METGSSERRQRVKDVIGWMLLVGIIGCGLVLPWFFCTRAYNGDHACDGYVWSGNLIVNASWPSLEPAWCANERCYTGLATFRYPGQNSTAVCQPLVVDQQASFEFLQLRLTTIFAPGTMHPGWYNAQQPGQCRLDECRRTCQDDNHVIAWVPTVAFVGIVLVGSGIIALMLRSVG